MYTTKKPSEHQFDLSSFCLTGTLTAVTFPCVIATCVNLVGSQLVFFFPKASAMLGFSFRRLRESEIECQDPVDGRWTSCGRAGAAEIAGRS